MFLLVSRSLWESLGSVEDEKTRRRREKQRRSQRNREEPNRNREGGSRRGKNRDRNQRKKNGGGDRGRGGANKKGKQMTTTTPTPQPSVDCRAEQRTAMETGRARQTSGGRSNAHYVPACKADGTFEQVQCYKVRNMTKCRDFFTG